MIGYIYKIQCPCELEYFGSTWDYESRFESHLCSMKYKDLKIYIHIRNCVVEGPLYFKFIEEVDVDCREELVFIEDKYIRFYNTVENGLNDRYAIFDENDIKKYKTKHYTRFKNKYRIAAAVYYQEHKEHIKNKSHLYNQKNKENRSIMNKKIVNCLCGVAGSKNNRLRHLKTANHSMLLSNVFKNITRIE